MNKILLSVTLIALLGWADQAIAHCGTCGEADNHGSKPVDAQHEKEKHLSNEPLILNIVDTASGNEDFTTLVAALKAADLINTLSAEGPFTVFAPTNAAFEALPTGTVEDLLKPENKEKLQSILTYHVISGNIQDADIEDGTTAVKTLHGTPVEVTKDASGINIDGAQVISADLKTSNGMIHAIDKVLMP